MNTLSKIVSNFCLYSCAMVLCLTPCSAQVQWEKDRESAVADANKNGKYVLYHFSADWCRPCRQLESFVFPNKAVARAIDEKVIPVKVDVDLNPDLVRKYGITGIPADVITTPSGRVVVQRQSPSNSDGYIAMMRELDRVDRNISSGNKAMQEKVHELGLTQPIANHLAKKSGDFEPPGAQPKQAPLSKESQGLEDKFVNKRFDVASGKLVDTNENAMVLIDATESEQATATPQTVTSRFVQSQTRILNGGDVQQTGSNLDRVFQAGDEKQVVANQFFSADAQITKNDFAAPADTDLNESPMLTPPETEMQFAQQAIADTAPEPPAAPVFDPSVVDSNIAERVEVDETKLVQQRAKTNVVNPAFNSEPASPVAEPVFALRGKCPVTLIQEGRWAEGVKEYGCVHRGKVYLFSDANKLKLFQNHPDDFSPLLAGYDPVKYMEDGELVDGKEKYGVFMGKSPNLRVVLFDTFENRKKFEEDPRMYLSGIRQAEMKATQTRIR